VFVHTIVGWSRYNIARPTSVASLRAMLPCFTLGHSDCNGTGKDTGREPGNLYDTKAKLHSELLPAQAKRKRASEQFIDKLDRRLLDVEASFQGVEPSFDDGDSDDVDSDEE
jgi:hypothetical protein